MRAEKVIESDMEGIEGLVIVFELFQIGRKL